MQYRTLGRTGIQVSTLGLGTMVLGAWGNTDHASCSRIVNRALDAGINLVDTADVYAFGESEEIVGAAIRESTTTTSCSPPSSTIRWVPISTHGATLVAGSCRPSRRACVASAPIASICIRCIDPIRRPTSRRPSMRSPILFGPARSSLGAPRRSRPRTSSRPAGPPIAEGCRHHTPSSRRTRSCSAASSVTCCPPAPATASA